MQVHVKQENNSRKLLAKRDRKLSTLPDIEDCSKCPESSSLPHTSQTIVQSSKYFLLSLSEQQDMSAVSHRALGRRARRSELPQKAGEEAASS